MPNFPRPSPFIITQAVTSGLSIPGVEIDPRHQFVRGAYLYAGMIDKLSMQFKSFKDPLTKSLNMVIIPSIIKNFEAEGRPKWRPLAKSTIASRYALGFPRGPILERTGRLKREATRKNIWEINLDILKLRTVYFDQKVPYAQFHQMGAQIPATRMTGSLGATVGKKGVFQIGAYRVSTGSRERGESGKYGLIPARPFIQLTVDEEVEIYNIFTTFMTEKVDQYWGTGSEGLG